MDYQNIMKELLNPSHSPARSGKDLSQRKVFSCKAGQLLPILCEEMVPNDYFEIDTASLIRTFPLQTAAFLRARVHFDFFFVPKTAIWRNWDRFYSQRNDHETNYSRSFAYEPNITLQDICEECGNGRITYNNYGYLYGSREHTAKIAQLLGYGKFGYASPTDFGTGGQYYAIKDKSLTILPAMGYHRIYNFWYRNAWRDEPNQNDANMYSADSWDCSSYATSLFAANYPTTSSSQPSIFEMHYHSWASDLFMSSLPNQQFGSVSTIDVNGQTGFDKGRWLTDTGASIIDNLNVITDSRGTLKENSSPALLLQHDHLVASQFDVMSLRKALALQKWKEYNMRAGWKTRNQARAMFGVSTPEDRKHEIEFLKGYEFPIMIDEVVSTNGASGGNIAELAGKGIGVGNGELLKFNSGERHGYLYCIAYVLPQAEYDATGIEKYLVRSEPFDHYVSAFENLGMEPIYKYELNAAGNAATFDSVLGYAPRYHEYKTRVDKVYGKFMAGNSLDSWVSVRRDLQYAANTGYIPTNLYYCNPACLDSIFAQSVDFTEDTDQFILNVNITDKAVRPMSDLGLPTL